MKSCIGARPAKKNQIKIYAHGSDLYLVKNLSNFNLSYLTKTCIYHPTASVACIVHVWMVTEGWKLCKFLLFLRFYFIKCWHRIVLLFLEKKMKALLKMGIRGVTVSDVRGFGSQGGSTERQGGKFISFISLFLVLKKKKEANIFHYSLCWGAWCMVWGI